MAVVPKKTYSKTQEFCSLIDLEKENVDPFDQLLSSPLKQDVQFKPLSFWGKKAKDLERKKKFENAKYRLYDTSNSDDNSPKNRKKKSRLKYSNHKGKTLSLKNTSDRKNNVFSTTRSFIKKSKSTEGIVPVQSTTLLSCEKLGQNKSQSCGNALYFSESRGSIINSFHKSCDGSEFVSVRKHYRKQSCKSELGPGCNITKYSVKADGNVKNNSRGSQTEHEKSFPLSNGKFKIYESSSEEEKTLNVYDESKEAENLTINLNNFMDKTLMPLSEDSNNFKFINVKRHYNNFIESYKSFNQASVSLEGNSEANGFLNQNNSSENLTSGIPEENTPGLKLRTTDDVPANNDEEDSVRSGFYFNDSNNESFGIINHTEYVSAYNDKEDLMGTTFCGCEMMGKTYSCMKQATVLKEEIKKISAIEFQTEDTVMDNFNFVYNNAGILEDLIQEPLLELNGNSITSLAESSLILDENASYPTDEESLISTTLQPDALTTGSNEGKEVLYLDSSLKGVSHLTTEISHLIISSSTESVDEILEPETERLQISENDANYKDVGNNSAWIDLRNVTTKRKYRSNGRYQRCRENRSVNSFEETRRENIPEREWELDETFEQPGMTGKTSFDWNQTMCFANPVFESTRVQDISSIDDVKTLKHSEKTGSLLEESRAWLDHSYALKPGKKWMRTVSVLKQIRNGNMTGDHSESSRIKGRKFESFVKDVLEMQNGKSGWSTSLADLTNANNCSGSWINKKKPFSHSVSLCCSNLELESSLKDVTFNSSVFPASCSDGTKLETSLIQNTIKIIHPEEKSSAFGLKESSLVLQGECPVKDESSIISGRDFILLQCGQDDVLPFEEYFNERTLKDCKKIGEGVYGEVFMSSDVVIKIIPIEGSEKVNGEPQKTFEEILSEVVIALKLSNLRNGKKNRTDGFSEVKRCWCVKGRYPKYLLRLWEEYDQSGNGSENDSPIMFKEDQLYVILELANGGKDLESFVFSSSSQSLSIFVQVASSLAAAEKAFEFEHRDLHWGNVLISETKDKFVTVVLDNVEYKIPSKGVKVCIIDFTLSRIYHEGFCIFNDLSIDPGLFASEGDYQFEIYRMMLREVRNDWSLFRPKTNIFWLHYTLDKMINMVRYKNKKSKLHKKCERELKILESEILHYKDSTDFVLSGFLSGAIKRM